MQNREFGRDSAGEYELTRFAFGAVPFDIGSLERPALTHLSPWQTVESRDNPNGFYYRVGMKTGVIDAEGDPATVFLHFAVPYAHRGHPMTPEDLIDLEVKLNTLVDVTTKQLSAVAGNVVGVRVNPPDYMLRELIQLLQK